MIGTRIPRLLLLAVALGAIVAAIMLTLFFGQYRWLANQLVAAGYDEHSTLLEASFERRARAELHAIVDQLPPNLADSASAELGAAMNRAMIDHPDLNGLRLTDTSGRSWVTGNLSGNFEVTETIWQDRQLLLSYPIMRSGVEVGQLLGSFDLSLLKADLDKFAAELKATEEESRRVTYLWIGGGAAIMMMLCIAVILLLARDLTRRIQALKVQAEKFRDADFGEPLPVSRGDQLAALASVFNEMRERLKTTTLSRDYVDSILSGMNEAIIVTNDTGQIKRLNEATTHLLGYDEEALIDTSIDLLVNSEHGGSLADDLPSGLPKETVLESKYGESIPVSYTCSIISGASTPPRTLPSASGPRDAFVTSLASMRSPRSRIGWNSSTCCSAASLGHDAPTNRCVCSTSISITSRISMTRLVILQEIRRWKLSRNAWRRRSR